MAESSAACTGFGDCGCDVCCPEPGSGRGVGHAGAPLGRSGDTEPRPGEFAAQMLPGWRFYLALGIFVGFAAGFLLGLWLGVTSA